MNYIILGSGGRECAVIHSLKHNSNNNLFCISNYLNPQINSIVKKYYVTDDIYSNYNILKIVLSIIENFNLENKNCIVFPGSENFLNTGIVNDLLKLGIHSIGPKKKMAMIETSKTFCRNYLSYNHLEEFQPKYFIVYNFAYENLNLIFRKLGYNFVVKDDGLKGGKGVRIYNKDNYLDAFDYCKEILGEDELDIKNTKKLIIEERLYGEEFVLMSFCDGKNISHMPIAIDFKDLGKDNNIKTGGMGSIINKNHSFNFLDIDDINKSQSLNNLIMNYLSRDDKYGYRGILYGSFMKTNSGIKLIEYNARFGDPECINVLSLLDTPLDRIFTAIREQKLDSLNILYKKEYSLCKYVVPNGYPVKPCKSALYINQQKDSMLYASVSFANTGLLHMLGSRSIAIVRTGKEMKNIYNLVESDIQHIQGDIYYRKDIGANYLENTVDNENDSKYNKSKSSSLYTDSGVNIEEGEAVVSKIKDLVLDTYDKFTIENFGDFGGLYNVGNLIKENSIENPILVSSTDGIGTKILLVLEVLGEKEGLISLGYDIVGHSVNDILVKGAKPLFFLDYIASKRITSENIKYFIEGVSSACKENNVVLLGGETAEMPDVYADNSYDVVGTIVGICDKNNIINGKDNIKEGDIVFGISSSGPHTNGYSLIRKVLKDYKNDINNEINLEDLVKPHRSYIKNYADLNQKRININGLCHITGGGFQGNLIRILPDDLSLDLRVLICEPFSSIQRIGDIPDEEMFNVFNCGIGMVLVVDEMYLNILNKDPEYKYLGKVVKRSSEPRVKIENCLW